MRVDRFIKYMVFFFFFFHFLSQLLEHPVWRHLQFPAHQFCQFSGKFEKSRHLFRQL